MRSTFTGAALAAAALAGCAGVGSNIGAAGTAGETPAAGAQISSADGSARATAEVYQVRNLLRVEVQAAGLVPGTYGVHIHQVGRCDGPGFESAGPHWNPTGRQHGIDNPAGAHKGDLPNLEVSAEGSGLIIFAVEGASLRGGAMPLLDADGAAVVIHARADDNRTDPSGNSGARIACGVIG